MEEDERVFCRHCGSKNWVKHGRVYSRRRGTWKRNYECKDCGRKFLGLKEHLPEQPVFNYQNQPVVKINWEQYNQAQINEKLMLMDLVDELLDLVTVDIKQRTGRPAEKVKDMLFCMLLKTYSKLSSRRLISDLKIAKDLNYISKVPCYSTVMLYFNDKRLQTLLQELVHVSAIPLKDHEEQFAIDSSGFSTSKFGRWLNHKWGKESEKRIFRKAHLMIGTKTNVVTSVQITDQFGADSPQFIPLVKKTALNFNIKEVSADKAYSSRANYEAVADEGAVAFIPFKKNAIGKMHGSMLWRKMFLFSKSHPQEFLEHYHRRSNVETTFHMIKTKFGTDLMTKNLIANTNEILCKILCHNLCCLIAAYFELSVNLKFEYNIIRC